MSPLTALTWIGVFTLAIIILIVLWSVFTTLQDQREAKRIELDLAPSKRAAKKFKLCVTCADAKSPNHKCTAPAGECSCLVH